MEWSRLAREAIDKAALGVPEGATFTERKKIIDEAYPFGPRAYWPYKAWLKARRAYLAKHDPKTPTPGPLFANLPRCPVTGRPVIA